jgi:hypothetical protein
VMPSHAEEAVAAWFHARRAHAKQKPPTPGDIRLREVVFARAREQQRERDRLEALAEIDAIERSWG